MADTIPDVSRAARQQRQDDWEAGVAWCHSERLIKRATALSDGRTPYGQFLFFQGIADALIAHGREVAGLDRKVGRA